MKVWISHVYTYIPSSCFPHTHPHTSRSLEHWAKLPVLHSSFLLSILHMTVYMSMLLSQFFPHLLPHCVHNWFCKVCISIPALHDLTSFCGYLLGEASYFISTCRQFHGSRRRYNSHLAQISIKAPWNSENSTNCLPLCNELSNYQYTTVNPTVTGLLHQFIWSLFSKMIFLYCTCTV